MDAVGIFAKYETATRKVTDDGEEKHITRRQYNERFDVTSPEIDIPEFGQHMWDWYFDLDDRISRVDDGVCNRIPPSEWLAWQAMTGEVVYSWEYDTLAAMDRAYCAGVNVEIAAGRALEKGS